MGRRKVIFSGVVWTVINNIVNILYGIVSIPFLISYFGKEEYGLIGIALSVNVYIQLLDMGMTNTNVRFFSDYIAKDEKNNVQKLLSLTLLFYFILGLINSAILFTISFFIEDLFKITAEQSIILRNLLWILTLNATFSWISICFDQFIRANELIDWIKKRSTLLKTMQFVILYVTIIYGLSIEIYFSCYIFLGTIILPLTIIKAKKINNSLILRFGFSKKILHTILPYSISIFSFSIFQFIALNLRPLILGNISGPEAVADFNIMNTIAMTVTIVSGSLMQVLLPIVTKMSLNSEWKNINLLINNGTKYATIVLSFLIFSLAISMDEIITIYVGVEYNKLVKWVILWLLTLLLSHRNIMTSLVFTEKKLKSIAFMGGIAMFFSILTYIALVPIYGVGGVVIGFLLHELIHTCFYYNYFLPKKFKINTKIIFLKTVLPIWLTLGSAYVILFLATSKLNCSLWSTVSIKIGLLGVTMLLIIWNLLLNKDDKVFLMSLIGFKKSITQ